VLAVILALLLASPAKEPPRVRVARERSAENIRELFKDASYPPRRILLRAFKEERQLELWAGGPSGRLRLLKTYPICASSGTLGPKTRAGDGQVPEGFYEITALNPYSQFLLSLRVSYPNARDRRLGHTGGDIFIHGSCVTIGCIPIEDGPIQELYVIAADARASGARIEVHIFPGRNWDRLLESESADPKLRAFWENLREGYESFERTREPPHVDVDRQGRYRFAP
jgi:murein L,D-transpeptidase YafK